MKNNYIVLLTVILAGYWINLSGQTAPRQGEILITEIMVNPEAVSDANGEWFEIWNATNHDVLLNGLTLKDAGSNQHVITSTDQLVMPAKSYWVLAKNGDILTNGGVVVNYIYQNFTLSNTSDQVIITAADETLIDQVSYGSGWPVVSGASMELHPDYQSFSGNDQPEHWFPARIAFGAGDKGSPGKANPLSSGLEEWEQGIRLDIFPNPSQGRFILEATFSKPQSGEIRMINLLGQDFIYKTFSERAVLREVIEPDFLTPGIWFIEVVSGGQTKATRLVIDR
ncbi:MAG: T9SS C-terminal target domain-containing protein [Porphyromonadaceae bacterium]|nr:MAG: T9SS C-terminal target domain-containing protein [Porphyromonadaceae bacterium]